jgi:hypothetical protein
MEKPENQLEVFSPILIQNHIKLLTVANCLAAEDKNAETIFLMSADNYEKIENSEIKTPLIGVILNYDEKTQKLKVKIEPDVYETYANKIMREVALQYKENYFHRYDNFIRCDE